jgi:2-polyprenyl-6-methoxyphenol hydroxylase-like FAD-dependent oxidoreductase
LLNVSDHLPVVVIVGGGLGGLAATTALKNVPAPVILIDSDFRRIDPALGRVVLIDHARGDHFGRVDKLLNNGWKQ